jgi:hypothetical protein
MNQYFTAEIARQHRAELLRSAAEHRQALEANPRPEPEPVVRLGVLQRLTTALSLRRSGVQTA